MRIATCLTLLVLLNAPLTAADATGPAPDPALAEATEPEVTQRMLQRLGSTLALALASDGLRARLAEELEMSPYVEGRVALKRLLAQDAGLREDVLWYADGALRWEGVQNHLPELELYFPLPSHRQAWTPQMPVDVAVPLPDRDRYRVFRSDGSVDTFDADAPPTVPTLLLARSEIDFDDAESARVGGSRTGGYLKQMAPERALLFGPLPWEADAESLLEGKISATSSGVDTSRHTYLTYFRIHDNNDPFQGSMEIEVFGAVDGSYKSCKRFTGIDQDTDYFLPAAGATGSRKIAFAVPTGSNTVDVTVYEDDDTGCVVKSGDDHLGVANLQITDFDTIFGTSTGEANVRVGTQNTSCGDSVCEGDETSSNCCADCASCGDGVCQGVCGESGSTCSADCPVCGNGICETSKGESSFTCSQDCSSCGNGLCEFDKGEDSATCPQDCCEDPQKIECEF